MRNILIIAVVTALTGCATMGHHDAGVTLEFRPGSLSPEPDLTEMRAVGSDSPVYISDKVLLSNADVESARVASGLSGPQIEIIFTKAGAETLAIVTEKNIGKPLGILIDGQLISAPIVMDRITGGKAVISGAFSEEEALRIANGVAGR